MKDKASNRQLCDKGLHEYRGENVIKNGKGFLCRECRNEYKRRMYHVKKQLKTTPIIHGENVLVPMESMPSGKTEKHTSYIVGHSETQHHHVLESINKETEFDIYFQNGEMYVSTHGPAKLVHQKTHDIHETVEVNPGIYKVNRKTEYDPFQKALRQVWD